MDKKAPPPRKKVVKSVAPTTVPPKPNPTYEPKRTEERIVKILDEIKLGLNPTKACLLHDTSTDSWLRWRACTNMQPEGFTEDGMEKTKDDRRCWECGGCGLQKRADAARLEYIKKHHEKVANATIKGEDVWTASAWLLERTEPDTYANKTKQEITHNLANGNNNAQKLVAAILGGTVAGQSPAN